MLATGGSAAVALDVLRLAGRTERAPGLHLFAAPEGIALLERLHGECPRFYTPSIDLGLNGRNTSFPAWVISGDRLYGTV